MNIIVLFNKYCILIIILVVKKMIELKQNNLTKRRTQSTYDDYGP